MNGFEPNAPLPADRLAFSIAEAARASGLCGRTIMNFINAGKLRSRRVGRRVLILRGDLERFLSRDHPSTPWRRNGRGKAAKA